MLRGHRVDTGRQMFVDGALCGGRAMCWVSTALAVLAALAGLGAGERALVAGTVRFGALFAVHGAPTEARAGARCGAVREHYGIQRVEATLLALDAINADAALLPNLRLGAELRDSCWAPPTALRQTIDLVRDAIAPPDAIHNHADGGGDICSLGGGTQGGAGAGWSRAAAEPLVAVLGPGASSAAVQVQNLLQLFSIPQVSYSATSRELSDRARFSTFFRVVPSDQHQARLLVALLRAHNWTFVHALHTDESYGQSGMAAFREEAARGGVCVAREVALRAAPAAREVDAVLARLAGGPRVAVCWCEGRTARALLAGLMRARPPLRLRLVASDGWADRRDVVEGLERAAHRSLTLRIRSPYLVEFDRHYLALRPHNNPRNPWFQEFWEQKFNCSLAQTTPAGTRRCTGSESLAANYTQEPKLALVVRGVYALAHALEDMRRAQCGAGGGAGKSGGHAGLCAAMLPFNVSLYRQHLARVRFRAPDGGLVAFDDSGDPPTELSEYDVMSFEHSEGAWHYARVGRWRRGVLRMHGGLKAAQKWKFVNQTRARRGGGVLDPVWCGAMGANGGGPRALLLDLHHVPAARCHRSAATFWLPALPTRTPTKPGAHGVSAARTATLCACVSLSAGACVVLSLGPRVWVCLCRPTRNTRAHFLTATSIRCHVGKYRAGGAGSTAPEPRRDSCSQTAAAPPCSAAGACARVVRTSRSDSADVLIVLLHHQHALPDALPAAVSP